MYHGVRPSGWISVITQYSIKFRLDNLCPGFDMGFCNLVRKEKLWIYQNEDKSNQDLKARIEVFVFLNVIIYNRNIPC